MFSPLSPQTTRGTGADAIFLDEAAHINQDLFFKTIVPILSMKATSLICLSSPEGESNYFSALMNITKSDGKTPFFQVVDCFQICPACRKLERSKQIDCTHIKSTAHWLSSRKIKELKQLYKASPEDAIREFGGIVISNYVPVFRKEEIALAFSGNTVSTLTPPPFLFTAADPNGGGPSHMSIASGYYNKFGELVVRISPPRTRRRVCISSLFRRVSGGSVSLIQSNMIVSIPLSNLSPWELLYCRYMENLMPYSCME